MDGQPWKVAGVATIVMWASAACVGAAGANVSNAVKLEEALAFAAAAGAAQVARSIAEQRARNNAPIGSTGLQVSPNCDNSGQYGCLNVSGSPPPPRVEPEKEMSDREGRDYVVGYVNGLRKLSGIDPVFRDEPLDAFAQAGSDELAQDHKTNQHLSEHENELHATAAEIQGPPDGCRAAFLQDQIAETLRQAMSEGPGGTHHDAVLRPEWRKLGVGIVRREGRLYFTVDFSSAP